MKHLTELLQSISVLSVYGITDRSVSSIENDSRVCKENSLFVAIRGTTTNDGHTFIGKAIENGACTIVCETLPDALQAHCTYVLVNDSREAVALLSNNFYDFPSDSLRVIGVTGTNGKTTVTYLLKQLLEATGEKVGLIGTTGNMVGNQLIPTNYTTPEAPELFRLLNKMKESSITTVVMEVSSHALVLKRVFGLRFSAAIFTNLTHDHLDFHGSMDEYSKAKQILFNSLGSNTISILNGDDEFALAMKEETKSKVVMCGRDTCNDYQIENERLTIEKTEFTLNGQQYTTPLPGRFNIDNVTLCTALCIELGIDRELIVGVLTRIKGAPGRMETTRLHNGAVAIVDYAHTPDALEKALGVCAELLEGSSGKLTVVFGCGGNRDILKRAEMGKISKWYADTVIITNDNPRLESPQKIIADIVSGISDMESVFIIPDRSEAIETALKNVKSGDILLIAGKGHENYQIIGTERKYFNDKEEVVKFDSKLK